jgi:Fic family protein
MEVANMSANQWAAVIAKSIKMREDVIPKGFYSRKQLEKMWKVSKGEANARLRDLINQNLVQKQAFKIKDARGICPVLHYKLIAT